MNLQQEDLDYIKDHLGEWIAVLKLWPTAAAS